MSQDQAVFVLARAIREADSTIDANAWARCLEDAIYRECIGVEGSNLLYIRKVRSMAFNLRNKRNPRWSREIFLGNITIPDAVRQTPRQIFPEIYSESDQAVWDQNQRTDPKEKPSDAGEPCGKCHSRNTTYTLMQTRRADEGSTEFWFCRDCGKRWKSGG